MPTGSSWDDISRMTLDYVRTDVPASFGDFRLNSGRVIRLFVRPDPSSAPLCSIYMHFAAERKQLVTPNSADLRLIVLNKCVKFSDLCLKCSQEIPPEPVGGGISDTFFSYDLWPEPDNDVICCAAVGYFGMNVREKFSDSESNGSRDIRGADFVSNEYDRKLSH